MFTTTMGRSKALESIGRAAAILAIAHGAALAQVPGVPVLQNAFTNPGLAFAANYAGGSGQSYFGAAAGWGMGSGRLMFSAGAGAQRSNGAARGAYGGRISASVWTSSSGSLGVGAFGGFGGAPSTKSGDTLTNAAVTYVPLGATVGFRKAIGSRGVSAYISPMYLLANASAGSSKFSTATSPASGLRFALGVDVGISSALGLTLGSQFGGGSMSGGGIAAALSFIPGR